MKTVKETILIEQEFSRKSRTYQLINELTANPQNIFQQTAYEAKCRLLEKHSEKELAEIIAPIVEKTLSQITIQVSAQKSAPDNL